LKLSGQRLIAFTASLKMPRGGSCDKAKAGKAGKAVKLLTFYIFIFISKNGIAVIPECTALNP
jgi:hypothetical protein